ncbi:MAG: pyruvate kinase [Bacteroidales bacterium]|jgi:pyruvate kinase|nr:pyruvate kinase [Bacteroidales bacterium]MCU0409675.1 pyruvate kinase [Bacteroidales bacterium]
MAKGFIKKRTKIVATISDKNCEPDFLRKLHEAGVDVVRINSAHLSPEGVMKIVNNTRSISDKIAILLDTKGPEIRTTICDEPIRFLKGQKIKIAGNGDAKTTGSVINVNYGDIARQVPSGAVILIDDGELEIKITGKRGDELEGTIENDGTLGSRKTVNIPQVRINLPSVSQRDLIFIDLAVKLDLEFIAHSFVRTKKDILAVQKILDGHGSQIKIIAKIENQQGVDNLEEIMDHSYGIMVARGDLAIEVPFERIPGIQRMIISRCIEKRKPVIVATQMLHSMITNPRPTRAEVSDVANAVYSQTDALMLSGETASGKFPLESVKTMTRIAAEIEMEKDKYLEMPAGSLSGEVSAYLAKVAVKTAIRVNARAILADTVKGTAIRNMAAYRGVNPVVAQCYTYRTMRELALSYGVIPVFIEKKESVDEFIRTSLRDLLKRHVLKDSDILVLLAGNFSRGSGFSFIEVGTVEYLKERVMMGKNDLMA